MIPFNFETALASGWFISGTSGCGKTSLSMCLVHQLMRNGVIVYVLDPSQEWKHSSIPTKTISENDENLTLDLDKSCLFDISRLHLSQQKNFVEKLSRGLFDYQVHLEPEKRRWRFFLFEESQLFLREGDMRSKAYEEIYRIITAGRNYKIRYGLNTQFAASISKLLIKITQQRYLGWTNERNDLTYLKSFIGKEVDTLKDLQVGEFVYNFGRKIQKFRAPKFGEESAFEKPTPSYIF